MKIFIIGPEGSGKTVFIAMLSHHIATKRPDLFFEPLSHESVQFVASTLQTLTEREWPRSTLTGSLKHIHWNFGPRANCLINRPLGFSKFLCWCLRINCLNKYDLRIFDAAGQDLRRFLIDRSPDFAPQDMRDLRDAVDGSDVLIFLLDIDKLRGVQDLSESAEESWLLKAFLTRPAWKRKQKIVILSKADLYNASLAEAGADIKTFIVHSVSPHLGLDHQLQEEKTLHFTAITSVKTDTEIGDAGEPVRKPSIPLTSEGMDELLDLIVNLPHRQFQLGLLCRPRLAVACCVSAAISARCFGWGIVSTALYFDANQDSYLGVLAGFGFPILFFLYAATGLITLAILANFEPEQSEVAIPAQVKRAFIAAPIGIICGWFGMIYTIALLVVPLFGKFDSSITVYFLCNLSAFSAAILFALLGIMSVRLQDA